MKRVHLVSVVIAALAALVASTAIVQAGWCWGDPVIGISAPGQPERDLTILVGMDGDDIDRLRGPVLVLVSVPRNVDARVKLIEGPVPERVLILRTGKEWRGGEVKVETRVVAISHAKFPVSVSVTYDHIDGGTVTEFVHGSSNADMNHNARMKP